MVTRTFNKWLMKTLCRVAERYIMERGDEKDIYLSMCIIKSSESGDICVRFNNDPEGNDHIDEFQTIKDPRDKAYEIIDNKEINNG